jgi:hypothetical protein
MQDLSSIQPMAPLVSAIITAAMSFVVAYFIIAKRKKVAFWIEPSVDLTLPLRRHHKHMVFKIDDRDFLNLNTAAVFVKNGGNTSIGNFKFDIEIPGQHGQCLAELVEVDDELRKAVNITWDEPWSDNNPRFHIAISPFFNRKETLKVMFYFNNTTVNCNVYCRIEDVIVKISRGQYRRFWNKEWVVALLLLLALNAVTGLLTYFSFLYQHR